MNMHRAAVNGTLLRGHYASPQLESTRRHVHQDGRGRLNRQAGVSVWCIDVPDREVTWLGRGIADDLTDNAERVGVETPWAMHVTEWEQGPMIEAVYLGEPRSMEPLDVADAFWSRPRRVDWSFVYQVGA
jgi:hypothetical protein